MEIVRAGSHIWEAHDPARKCLKDAPVFLAPNFARMPE